MITVHAGDRKEPVTPATPRTPGMTFSGAVPFQVKVDAPAIAQATAALGLKEAAAALDLPKVAEALSKSPALERAVDKLKDIKIDVSSDALQQTAKILRSIDIQVKGSPQLRHSLTHKHTLTVPTITADQVATKGFGGVAFIYALTHGTHPLVTGCLGCLTFAPYPMIKEASYKTYGALKNQFSRCFNHKKRQERLIRPLLDIDLEAARALIKAH